MNAIRVGNIILAKDKVVSVILKGQAVVVNVTVGETMTICYDSKEDAQKAFEEIYKQLNKE